MALYDWIQLILYFGVLIFLTPLIGSYLYRVLSGETPKLVRFLKPLEKGIYRISGVDPNEEMHWTLYAKALLIFNLLGFVLTYLIQVFQGVLPLNPQGFSGVSWHSAFNTAVSFVTNTNWQGYAGETTMSYFTQMLALTVQNFVSAGVGMAVLLALVRGLTRKTSKTIGNFWADLTKTVVYVLLPLCFICSLVFVSEGVVQNLSPYVTSQTLEGKDQVLPMGPAASQIAIKQVGTNGGGFFNANSAHPFENPTPFTNFIEMLLILLIPAAQVYAFGLMVGSKRQGRSILIAMYALLLIALVLSLTSEFSTNPILGGSGLMEGKEQRFGVTNSVLWSVVTTAASSGSVNAMHSSLSPLSGGIATLNIMLGEIVFGGVGAGLYGMLLFVLLTVFLAGLMVGRTPEYLGKKIEAREITMVILAIVAPSAIILVFAGISSVISLGLSSLANTGPHGLSEILYAFSSAAGNNGSAFAGLNANTPYYNVMLGIAMLVGRFIVIVPALAIAGSLVTKKISPPSSGTFSTDTGIFIVLLVGVILIVGALTFLPVLTLGPIVEHFLMINSRSF